MSNCEPSRRPRDGSEHAGGEWSPPGILHRLLPSLTARNIVRVFLGDGLSKVFLVLFTLLVIRGLSEANYAAFVVFQSVRILFSSLVGNGINSAMVRYGAEYFSRTGRRPLRMYKAVLRLQVLAYSVLLVGGLVLARPIARSFYGREDYGTVVVLGLLAGAGYLLISVTRSIYQAEERFNQFVAAQWVQALAGLLYVCMLVVSHRMTFTLVAVGLIVVDLAIGLALLTGSVLRHRTSPDEPRSDGRVGWVLKAARWLMAYCIALALLSQMDVIMLSRLGTELELARYGVALKYYVLALLSLGAINAVLLPKFSRVDMQSAPRQRAFVRRWVRSSVLVAVPLALFDLLGRPLFVWLNGGKYGEAFGIWILLSVGIWISLVASPMTNILVGRRMFRTLFILGLGGLATSYLGNVLLVPWLRADGTAIATVAANAVINVTCLCLVWRSKLAAAADAPSPTLGDSPASGKISEMP